MDVIEILFRAPSLPPSAGAQVAVQALLPTALAAARDRVPNIRFNIAKLLQSLAPLLDAQVIAAQVRPCLDELAGDADPDVR